MTDELISFPTALLAKKLGFDVICHHWYRPYDKKLFINQVGFSDNSSEQRLSAPSQTLLARWLRFTRYMHVEPSLNFDPQRKEEFGYRCYVFSNTGEWNHVEYHATETTIDTFLSYEGAMEAGLRAAMDILLK